MNATVKPESESMHDRMQSPFSSRIKHRLSRLSHINDVGLAWLFITPTFLILLLVNIFPLIWTIYLSFTSYRANIPNFPVRWVGLDNYYHIFQSDLVWEYLQITANFTFWTVLLEAVLGLSLALLLNRKFRGHALASTLLVLPMLLSPVLVGLFWQYILNPQIGIFNYLINAIFNVGSFSMLSNPHLAILATIGVDVWKWTPFIMLLSLAGLQSVPDSLYEAAKIDRASRLRTFWNVTFPHVLPLLLIAVLFKAIISFLTFGMVLQLTGGGPGGATQMISIEVRRAAFVTWKTGYAAALAVVMFAMVLGVSAVFVRYLNRVSKR